MPTRTPRTIAVEKGTRAGEFGTEAAEYDAEAGCPKKDAGPRGATPDYRSNPPAPTSEKPPVTLR